MASKSKRGARRYQRAAIRYNSYKMEAIALLSVIVVIAVTILVLLAIKGMDGGG